jgi:hypothetical protein
MKDDRLKKLAQNLDALAEKDDLLLRQTQEVERLRRAAALQLHTICRNFVEMLNPMLERMRLELQPEEYTEGSYSDERPNLLQLNAHGRVVQMEFSATETLTSTEHFRKPYILEGSIRCFNQELLERLEIQEHQLFYCVDERRQHAWYYFDARTYRSGLFNQEYLVALMELLV